MSDPPPPPTSPVPSPPPPPPTGPDCPIHDYPMEENLYENDETGEIWKYFRCSEDKCPVGCGEDRIEEYLPAISNPEKLHPKWLEVGSRSGGILCRCQDPVRLSLSKSESNPNRLYFTCRGKSCRFFKWADRRPPLFRPPPPSRPPPTKNPKTLK